MAARSDVRDVLDLPTENRPKPSKKIKVQHVRPEGVSREVFALYGDNVAPVALVEKSRYRSKPGKFDKRRAWRWTPFINPARDDGLKLHHWRQKQALARPDVVPSPTNANTPASLEVIQEDPSSSTPLKDEPTLETEYYSAKYNIKPDVATYDDQQYAEYLQDDGWTREETDYLMELCRAYDLRWILIADRFDYRPSRPAPDSGTVDEGALSATPRTTEDLKARYYYITRKMLELRTPLSNMTPAEFSLYNTLDFDAVQETKRKAMLEILAQRSPAEVQEEEFLLAELQRIIMNQDRLLEERKELYARLEPIPYNSNINVKQFLGSAGLTLLMQNLMKADSGKRRKNPPNAINTQTEATNSRADTPTQPQSSTAPANRDKADRSSRGNSIPALRHSNSGMTTPATPTTAVGTPGTSGLPPPTPANVRKLSAAEERLYGVAYHADRVTQGPHFRHDRALKLVQNRTSSQAARVTAALTELGIPARLVMPTGAVCAVFEELVGAAVGLLECRRVRERLEGEVRVVEGMAEERAKGEGEGEGVTKEEEDGGGEEDEAEEKNEGLATADVTMENEDDEDADDDEAEAKSENVTGVDAPVVDAEAEHKATRGVNGDGLASGELNRKRSASVLSGASGQANKRSRK